MKEVNNNYSFIDKAETEEIYHRLDRRWNAESPILRYAHRKKFEKLLTFINPGQKVLDIGRGGSVDGVLGVLAAKKGALVTILNVSDRHIASIQKFASKNGVLEKIQFVVGNPQICDQFENNSFDTVISLHVLEHLESTSAGLDTIHRVTNSKAIIALPTCLNPCVWIRFGKQNCYEASLRSFLAIFKGMAIVSRAALRREEGVVEKLTEDSGNVCDHIWRFPSKMKTLIKKHDFKIIKFGPDTMCLPWFEFLQPITEFLDNRGYSRLIRNLGYGSHALIEKNI